MQIINLPPPMLYLNPSVKRTIKGISILDLFSSGAANNEIPPPVFDEKGIRLEFAQFGHFDSFEVIRSLTSMIGLADHELPAPIATGLKTMRFIDQMNLKSVLDRDLYYRVRVIRGNQSLLSDELQTYISTFSAPQNLIVAFANNALEMEWDFENVTELHYYCSEFPIDINNLPLPKAVIAGNVRTYVDTDIDIGKTYYICIGSVKNGVEKLSDEIAVLTESWNPSSIAKTPKIYLDDKLMTSQVWGSNTNADYSFSKPTSVAAPTIVQSAINGLPILRFDNNKALIADITKTSNFAKSAKVVYVFAVSKLRAINANYRRLFSVTGSQSNPSYARFSLLNGNVGGNQIWAQVGASNNTEYTISAAATNNFEAVLLKADFKAGNLKLYKNNALIATTALPTSATTATPAQTYAMSIGALFNGSYLQFTDADIACIVANDNDLTDTEIESLFEWASGKYGI